MKAALLYHWGIAVFFRDFSWFAKAYHWGLVILKFIKILLSAYFVVKLYCAQGFQNEKKTD